VDQSSGYRFYKAEQLSRLNRIVALKDLGFTLQQVRTILDEDVSTEELRGMLRLRRAELEAALAETASDLAQVEARLRSIENEGSMPQEDVIIRPLPAIYLAELSGTAASFSPDDAGPLIGRLFDELRRRLDSAGITPVGPRAVYFKTPGSTGTRGRSRPTPRRTRTSGWRSCRLPSSRPDLGSTMSPPASAASGNACPVLLDASR
jgi:DNA-binding transcriptional MerR regulator